MFLLLGAVPDRLHVMFTRREFFQLGIEFGEGFDARAEGRSQATLALAFQAPAWLRAHQAYQDTVIGADATAHVIEDGGVTLPEGGDDLSQKVFIDGGYAGQDVFAPLP
jgi:hypothetical protein